MAILGRSFAPDLIFPDRLRQLARRQSGMVLGAALVLCGAALALALATWSVGDASLNHATGRAAHNLLGFPGAAAADLFMQSLGLASIIAVYPLLRWGWISLSGRSLPRRRRKLAAALAGLLAAAGAFSALPVAAAWPLPGGLGGFLGDRALAVAMFVLGPIFGFFAFVLCGLLFAALAMLTLAYATDTHFADLFAEHGEAAGAAPARRRSWLPPSVMIGLVGHTALAARARALRLMRRLTGRASSSAPLPAGIPGQNGGEGAPFAFDDRIEPHFGAAERRHQEPPMDDYGDDGGAAAGRSYHVEARAPDPRPGRRIEEERQPSLLPGASYQLPHLRLLAAAKEKAKTAAMSAESLEQNARLLEGVLEDFGVKGEIINVRPGPVVTLYELEPAPGIKSSRVIGLADDIARSMSAVAARVAVVPGRNVIGIELPNAVREMVFLREILASLDYERSKARLPLALGKTIGGEAVIADLARMPHLLIAGTTGSGKSVGINTMILSLLYRLSPEQCRLIMIDPKMLELSVYDGIPHLLSPVVTDPKKAIVALKWTVREMEERYKSMSRLGVRNIDGFNQRVSQAIASGETITRTVQTGFDRETGEALYETEEMTLEPMPYLVVIVDEMADLMMVAGKDIEGAVQRLAQMARAAGIHMITATQRPSVDVITGTIKANFPTRISFQVTSKIDSRTILGEQGAEQLLGMGDMLYMAGGGRVSRVHGPFVSDDDVERVVAYLKKQGAPDYLEAVTEEPDEDGGGDYLSGLGTDGDDLYQRAIQIVLADRKASTSYIQRRLSIGYNRAATIIERLEQEGIVSPANHAGKREILLERGA